MVIYCGHILWMFGTVTFPVVSFTLNPRQIASVDKPVHKPEVEDEVMAKLHPLLAGDLNDEADNPRFVGLRYTPLL